MGDTRATVTAVIPSLPERHALLGEAVKSVAGQTRPPERIIVELDPEHTGAVATRNRALRQAATTWVAFLDDDDLWYPHHLETLLAASDQSDVVYTYCDVEGREDDFVHNQPWQPRLLSHGNYIPVTTLVRLDLLESVGYFPDHPLEDWQLWITLRDLGARFRCVPEVTWLYRFHDSNRTWEMA